MKPYFETEHGTLYHGDCLEIMPELEPVDLVLTDPPYGTGIEVKGFGRTKHILHTKFTDIANWDTSRPPKKTFVQMIQNSKNQIIFGGNYFADPLSPSSCWLIWDKRCGVTPERTFADGELAWTSFNGPTRIIRFLWDGMIQQNMKCKEKRVHPTQKPVGLFVRILEKHSIDPDIIFDPFLGSGTTAIACERLNRRWIGIEISEEYCEIAAKRIERETQQLKLFG